LDVAITLGHGEDNGVNVEISDDTAYTPEVLSDLLRRAADTALRLHHEMHPTDAE
jgi:hypothetical protein